MKSKQDFIIAAMSAVLSNPNAKLIGDKQKIINFIIEIGSDVYEASKPETKRKTIPEIVTPPDQAEFVAYAAKLYSELKKDFSVYEFAIKSKYEDWINNKWRDGFGKPITNWKSKLKNTIPSLKAVYPTGYDHAKPAATGPKKTKLN